MGSAKCSYCGLMMETSEGASFGPHEEGCPYGKDPEILRVFSDGQEDGANGREKEPNRGATYNLGFQKGLEVLESVREAQSFDLKSVESAPH